VRCEDDVTSHKKKHKGENKLKIHNNKTKATLLAVLLIGLTILSPSTLIPNVNAELQNNINVNPTSKCKEQILSGHIPELTSEQQQIAIKLAENSESFLKNVGNSGYTVISVGPNYSFDSKTCSNFVINGVGVYFKLSNGSSLDIFEDGKMSKVVEVKIPSHIRHDLKNIWSGYEVYYQQTSGTNSSILYGDTNYDQPSVVSNSACTSSPDECDLSDWAGIDNHGRYLVQTGTDAIIDCTTGTCSSQENTAWWEYIDVQSGTDSFNACPGTDTVSPSDPMNPVVENGGIFGGSSNQFRIFLIDNSASNSWLCSSGTFTWTGASVPDTALAMLERPAIGGVPTGLPSFGTVSNTGSSLCYGSGSGQCTGFYTSTSNNWDAVIQMQNCPPNYNIKESSMNTNSDFDSTYQNSCGT